MKMPPRKHLDDEQLDIIEDVGLDKPLLVTGPPGTGKTVIAMMRANDQALKGSKVDLVMFGHVLRAYAGKWRELNGNVTVKTYNRWFSSYWWSNFREYAPQIEDFVYDWDAIIPIMLRNPRPLGTVVLDEGQDHPPDFYKAMGLCQEGHRLRLTVVADENQRIVSGLNSSIDDIRQNLGVLGSFTEKALKTNHRNTRPIAQLASRFFADNQTGIAALPNRPGDLPRLLRLSGTTAMANRIAIHAKNNPEQSTLVVCPNSGVQQSIYRAVLKELGGDQRIKVDGYGNGRCLSGLRIENAPVGENGCIFLVLHQSMKGLEADAVFVPHLEQFDFGESGSSRERMTLYVLCSRARTALELQYIDQGPNRVVQLFHAIPDSELERR